MKNEVAVRGHPGVLHVLVVAVILGGASGTASGEGQTDATNPHATAMKSLASTAGGTTSGPSSWSSTSRASIQQTPRPSKTVERRSASSNLLPLPISQGGDGNPIFIEHPIQHGTRLTSTLIVRELENLRGDTPMTPSTINKVVDEDDVAVVGGVRVRF